MWSGWGGGREVAGIFFPFPNRKSRGRHPILHACQLITRAPRSPRPFGLGSVRRAAGFAEGFFSRAWSGGAPPPSPAFFITAGGGAAALFTRDGLNFLIFSQRLCVWKGGRRGRVVAVSVDPARDTPTPTTTNPPAATGERRKRPMISICFIFATLERGFFS